MFRTRFQKLTCWATVTKMITFQAIYQIAITLTLHFVGPKALRPISKGHVTETEFG